MFSFNLSSEANAITSPTTLKSLPLNLRLDVKECNEEPLENNIAPDGPPRAFSEISDEVMSTGQEAVYEPVGP